MLSDVTHYKCAREIDRTDVDFWVWSCSDFRLNTDQSGGDVAMVMLTKTPNISNPLDEYALVYFVGVALVGSLGSCSLWSSVKQG